MIALANIQVPLKTRHTKMGLNEELVIVGAAEGRSRYKLQ